MPITSVRVAKYALLHQAAPQQVFLSALGEDKESKELSWSTNPGQ